MRRALWALVAVGLLAVPACGDGDDPVETFTIAFLRAVESSSPDPLYAELRRAGFVVGERVEVLPTRETETHPDPDDAERTVREWVDQGADIVFAFSTTGARAAAKVTPTVPILFLVNDPVAVGLVRDEARPERNLTGVTFRVPADRTLDLARQAIPGLERVGILWSATDPAAAPHRDSVAEAAEPLGLTAVPEAFASEDDVARALDALVAADVQAVVVGNSPTAVMFIDAIQSAAEERGIPLVANTRFVPDAVVVLEPDPEELQGQLGRMAVRLLQGADPGEIPVEDPRRFRVLLNAGQALALGLPPLPDDLLRQADQVIR